jgi:two-component system LytT family response regulator
MANKIRTLIVDDEPLAREGLALLVGSDPDVEVIGAASDGAGALETIRNERPELVFLDVQMPELDGFEVLNALPPDERPFVIFVTAYEQHAIRAFEVCAVDYLLKPYSNSRFVGALNRAKQWIRDRQRGEISHRVEQLLEHVRRFETPENAAQAAPVPTSSRSDPADRIVLKADGALHFVKASDVIWLEAQGDFVKVQTPGKTQMVRETLQSMEKRLDSAVFLRIHRSFIVNLEHVKRVETALYGDYSVYMSDGSKLRLSRSYRSKLKALIRQTAAA